jgi:hypothetical protein
MCTLSHASVWQLTSNLLPQFLQADEFIVYVPQAEVEDFVGFTDPSVRVMSEESLSNDFKTALRSALEVAGNLERFGWYYQQFLKIEALRQSKSKEIVIWDADCVPVAPLKLIDSNGLPVYMKSGEFHKDYFLAIERLLEMKKVVEQSFVVPGFPILKTWVEEFLLEVENRHPGAQWFEAILNSTDLSLDSGFSEFETLGTWVTNTYPNGWVSAEVNWERFGRSRFGHSSNFTPDDLIRIGTKKNLQIISFENWDTPGLRSTLRRGKRAVNQARRARKGGSPFRKSVV